MELKPGNLVDHRASCTLQKIGKEKSRKAELTARMWPTSTTFMVEGFDNRVKSKLTFPTHPEFFFVVKIDHLPTKLAPWCENNPPELVRGRSDTLVLPV